MYTRQKSSFSLNFSLHSHAGDCCTTRKLIFVLNHRYTQIDTDEDLMNKICVHPCVSVVTFIFHSATVSFGGWERVAEISLKRKCGEIANLHYNHGLFL